MTNKDTPEVDINLDENLNNLREELNNLNEEEAVETNENLDETKEDLEETNEKICDDEAKEDLNNDETNEENLNESSEELSERELELKAKLDKALNDLTVLKESYIRANADFENIKKRFEREKTEIASYANEKILKDLIPILDALELANKFEADDNFSKGLKEGIENTLSLCMSIFKKHGIEEIDAKEGDDYDYTMHEAMTIVESDYESNKIVQVFQKGYSLNGRVIRACKVIVSK